MFEWLADEMAKIKTRKFHLVDGPAAPELRKPVDESDSGLPLSYKEFVLLFGNAKLYRRDGYYYVTVHAGPRKFNTSKGEPLVQFGGTWTSSAYFKEEQLMDGRESAVFESYYKQGIKKTADGFEEWLRKKCVAARKRYKKKEWQAIECGPPPFSDQERSIVESRGKFRWRLIGISENGSIQFEVHNGSKDILPYLTIGIRGKRRNTDAILEGGIWLPVRSVLPGKTVVVEKDCYFEWVDPQDVIAFEEPDPEPEDRDRYWEFKPQ
ncbi:MAG: hypothetical protein ACKVP0_11355 [Pirellulaceae bacterium]